MREKDWVVYAKPPIGGPERVLKYLARYTHRVAISNQRLLSLEDGKVAFRTKDYAAGGRAKTLTLSAEEFLRRFTQHILPKGFVKIRHYGLLGNRQRAERLKLCRRLLLTVTVLGVVTGAATGTPPAQAIAPPTPVSCPRCGGVHFERHELLPSTDDGRHASGSAGSPRSESAAASAVDTS